MSHGVVRSSRISGEFTGWNGNSIYKLDDGSVWEQSVYKYQYVYQYRPTVIVVRANGGYVMRVANTEARVTQIR